MSSGHFLRQYLIVGSALFSRIAIYLILIAAARLLDPAQFGIFGFGITVAGIIAGVVSGGDMWLNRFSRASLSPDTTYPVWQAYFWAMTRMAVVCGLLVVGVGLMIFENGTGQKSIIFAIAATGIVMGLGECIFAMLRAQHDVGQFFSLRDIVIPLGVLALMLLMHPDTATATLWIHIGVWALSILAAVALIWRNLQPARFDATRHRKLRSKVMLHHLSLAMSNLSARLAAYFDILAITWYAPIAFVGEYRVSAQIAIGFWIVQHFLFLGLPWQLRQKKDQGGAEVPVVLQRQRLLLAASFAGYLFLFLAAKPLLGLFGERFEETSSLFRLLLAVRLCDVLWGPQHELMVSNGLAREDGWANFISIALWPILFLGAHQFFSMVGAAVAAVCFSAAAGHCYRHIVLRTRNINPYFGQPLGAALPITISIAIACFSSAI